MSQDSHYHNHIITDVVKEMYLVCQRWTTALQWNAERAGDLVRLRRRIRCHDCGARAVPLELAHHLTLPFPMLFLLRRKTRFCDSDTKITLYLSALTTPSAVSITGLVTSQSSPTLTQYPSHRRPAAAEMTVRGQQSHKTTQN